MVPEYVVAYTNAATIVAEDFADTEDLDGLFSGWDGDAPTTRPPGATRTWSARAGGRGGSTGGAVGALTRRPRRGLPGRAPPDTDPTLEHPRCVFQMLRGTSPATHPSWWRRSAAFPASCSSRSPRRCATTPGASAPPRSATRSAGPSTRSAFSTSARRDHPAAARQHRAPGRRHHGAARPRVDPGLDGHPDALQHPARLPADAPCRGARGPAELRREQTLPDRLLGPHGRLHDQPAEGLVGRCRDGRERMVLRPPAPHHGGPLDLPDDDRTCATAR